MLLAAGTGLLAGTGVGSLPLGLAETEPDTVTLTGAACDETVTSATVVGTACDWVGACGAACAVGGWVGAGALGTRPAATSAATMAISKGLGAVKLSCFGLRIDQTRTWKSKNWL